MWKQYILIKIQPCITWSITNVEICIYKSWLKLQSVPYPWFVHLGAYSFKTHNILDHLSFAVNKFFFSSSSFLMLEEKQNQTNQKTSFIPSCGNQHLDQILYSYKI